MYLYGTNVVEFLEAEGATPTKGAKGKEEGQVQGGGDGDAAGGGVAEKGTNRGSPGQVAEQIVGRPSPS